MGPLEALARADDEFDRRIRLVGRDEWDLPTACVGWSVRDLVAHVVGGNRMSVVLLRGGSRDDAMAIVGTEMLGDDPVAASRRAPRHRGAVFVQPGALDRTVPHPMGDIAASQFLEFRVADLTLHAWDLAPRSVPTRHSIPSWPLRCSSRSSPWRVSSARSGCSGPGRVATYRPSAPAQARLLDITGRRP